MSRLTSVKIQWIRGICAFLVVVSHSLTYNPLSVYISPFTHFCTAIFIFLSGYLTKMEIDSIGGFYKKRLIRVLIPYIIWSVIYCIFNSNLDNIFYLLLTGQACNIYYYILVYIQLVILTPLIVKIAKTKLSFVIFFITPISLLVIYYLEYIGHGLEFPMNCNLFTVWIAFYYLGMCLRSGKVRVNISLLYLGILQLIAFGIEIVEGLYWRSLNNGNMTSTQVKFTGFFTAIVMCFLISKWFERDSSKVVDENRKKLFTRIICYLGDCAFGIYLIHQMVMVLEYDIYPELSLMNFMIYAGVTTLVSLAIVSILRIVPKRISKYLGVY